MKRKNLGRLMLIICLSIMMPLIFTGCSSDKNAEGKETDGNIASDTERTSLKIGITASFEDFVGFIPEKMAKLGYDVEFTVFDDVTTPNIALAEGSIDANFYQHKPYLDAYNEANKTDLYACEPYIISSMDAIISLKYNSLEELPEGAEIGISDDASNLSANLHSLQFAGLIKLATIPDNSYYTVLDITENPKNFKFVELPMGQKVNALPDLDAMVNFYGPGIAKTANILKVLSDDPSVPFPVVVAVDGKSKDEKWVKDFMDAMTGDELKAIVEKKNEDVLTWRILFE